MTSSATHGRAAVKKARRRIGAAGGVKAWLAGYSVEAEGYRRNLADISEHAGPCVGQ